MIPETTSVAEQQVNDQQQYPLVTPQTTVAAETDENIKLALTHIYNLGKSSRETAHGMYRRLVCECYALIIQYWKANDVEREKWKDKAKDLMTKERIRSETTVPRMFIRLALPGHDASNAGKIEDWVEAARTKGHDAVTIYDFYDLNSPQKLYVAELEARKAAALQDGSKPDKPRSKLISTAKDALKAKELLKIDVPADITAFEQLPAGTAHAAIITFMDGKLVINGFVKDSSIVDDLYAEFARDNPDVIKAQEIEQLIKLANTPKLDIKMIKEKAGGEIAKQCSQHHKGLVGTKDFYKNVPIEFEYYKELLRQGDAAAKDNEDGGTSYFEGALEYLGEMKEMGIQVDLYLDRDYDQATEPSREGVPRLRSSQSSQNQTPLKPVNRVQAYRRILIGIAKELKEGRQDDKPDLEKMRVDMLGLVKKMHDL